MALETKGYDLSVTYGGVELGRFGALDFNLTGTYLDELIEDPGGGFDAVRLRRHVQRMTCGTPNPEWRHHFRTGWESPWNVDVSLTWRYYDAVELFRGDTARIDYELDGQNYFDLAASWDVTEKASVLLGINNVLDDDPPLTATVGTTGNGNTYPQTYDALGRFIFLRGRSGSDTGLKVDRLAAASRGAAAFFWPVHRTNTTADALLARLPASPGCLPAEARPDPRLLPADRVRRGRISILELPG